MSYCLENQETLVEGFRRIGAAENKAAIDALAHDDEAVHQGIHQARRHFKRLRSLFGLIRGATGKAHFREANRFYQGLAQELEGLRDISSLIEAVGLLRGQFGHLLKGESFSSLLDLLEEEKAALEQRRAEQGGGHIERVIQALRAGRERFSALPVAEDYHQVVLAGFCRYYRSAYECFRENLERPSPRAMHEWRKQSKHLWHAYRLLKNAWPPVFKGYAKAYEELGNILGDYHDLTLLQDKIGAYGELLPEDSSRLLQALAQEQIQTLQRRSLSLGQRLFAEKPAAFRRRMRLILTAWEIAK
jgi:CHAD domain-containing protein